MASADAPLARSTQLEVVRLHEETVVYDLRTDKAHCLNPTSARVWKSCDGRHTAGEIASAMERELGSAVPVDVVALAIAELGKAGLLELPEGTKAARGISRREVVRRTAGLATIALPVISTLLAPTSASAASVSCACSNPGECLAQTTCPSTVNCNGSGICAP